MSEQEQPGGSAPDADEAMGDASWEYEKTPVGEEDAPGTRAEAVTGREHQGDETDDAMFEASEDMEKTPLE